MAKVQPRRRRCEPWCFVSSGAEVPRQVTGTPSAYRVDRTGRSSATCTKAGLRSAVASSSNGSCGSTKFVSVAQEEQVLDALFDDPGGVPAFAQDLLRLAEFDQLERVGEHGEGRGPRRIDISASGPVESVTFTGNVVFWDSRAPGAPATIRGRRVYEMGQPTRPLRQNLADRGIGMLVEVGKHSVGDGVASRRRRYDQLTRGRSAEPAPERKVDQDCRPGRMVVKPEASQTP